MNFFIRQSSRNGWGLGWRWGWDAVKLVTPFVVAVFVFVWLFTEAMS
jgi:hypothetical protein